MKLMIVDDSRIMVRILSIAAHRTIKNVELFECFNGKEALECIEENPDVQLILLDVNMPVMSGKEFLQALRSNSQYDDVKVIMQTTETGRSEIKDMMQLGISGYLIKPYRTSKVMDFMVQLAHVLNYETIKEQ